ncbi:MAG: cytochrome c oxidase subunit II, partial [Acetobacteraceae bacterium]|nr:cytochrome c oxidase subunit II [Acetobacteraceae bacterium]
MNSSNPVLSIWPASASASAVETDHLIWLFTLLTLALVVPIFIGITFFAVRYRDGKRVNRVHRENRDRTLEVSWMLIPFVLTLIFFGWGARMFIIHKNPPPNAMRIEAIGRQWMWKFQHPGGQAEINDLHVPTGEPILIHMISQDVIHSLYIPALRIQMETLPNRYTEFWFNANRPGTYHILCSEFCGTDHSVMGGNLVVMTPADYADWLTRSGSSISLEAGGARLFAQLGCSGCHEGASTPRAPSLAGLAGSPVPLADGGTVIADDAYIRDKILNPD